MKEQIRLLQAEIQADIEAIKEAYKALNQVSDGLGGEKGIVVGYYLHVLYGLFENLFARIATTFGNQITDEAKWHSQLLRRMTLDVKDVRPRVIGRETFECLEVLRRFRHLFRNAYVLRFDPDRLGAAVQSAQRLEQLYRRDLSAFLRFLDDLAGEAE
jgi:hypothetical protein